MSAWKRVWKRTHSNDGAVNSCIVRSSPSTDDVGNYRNMIWAAPNEMMRSCSADELWGGDYVESLPAKEGITTSKSASWNLSFDTLSAVGRSYSNGDVSNGNVTKYSSLKEDTVSTRSVGWTLPTNIVYGPQDLVKDPQDLNWTNSKEDTCSSDNVKTNLSNEEASRPETSPSNDNIPSPKIVTWGPAKDFIRRYMKRSISMDENYNDRIVTWTFPDEDEDCTVNNSSIDATKSPRSASQDFNRTIFKNETSSPLQMKKSTINKEACAVRTLQPKENERVVTWGLAKTLPVTIKRSPSTDKEHQTAKVKSSSFKNNSKNIAWAVPKPVTRSAKRSTSIDVDYYPGYVKVSPSRHYTRSSRNARMPMPSVVKRSASTDEDCNGNALQNSSRKCKKVEWAVPKGIPRSDKRFALKDYECGAVKVKRSLSIDSLGGSASEMCTQHKDDSKPSIKIDLKDEFYNTGLVKRSRSIDGVRSPKTYARATRKDISSPSKQCASKNDDYIPCKLKRSLSIDGTSSSSNTARRLSQDVAIFPVTPFTREEYYNTGLVKRSRSMDGVKSPKTVEWAIPKEIPSAVKRSASKDELCDAGKVKRSLSVDVTENIKRVTWAIPTEAPSLKRSVPRVDSDSPGKVKRSVSIDCAGNSKAITWFPKSILKESVYKDEYYNTGMVKRSRSIDGTKSSKNVTSIQLNENDLKGASFTTEICSHRVERPLSNDKPSKTIKLLAVNQRLPEEAKEMSKKSLTSDEDYDTNKGKILSSRDDRKQKNVTFSLPIDDGQCKVKKSLSKEDVDISKRMTRSASRKIVVNAKREPCKTRPASKTRGMNSKIVTSATGSPAKDKTVNSKTEDSVSKRDSAVLNEVKKSVIIDEASALKKVVRTATGSIIETKSLIRKDITCSVNTPNDAKNDNTSAHVHEGQTPMKLNASMSWDEAITFEDRNRSNLSNVKRSFSRDGACYSVEVKRSASTDAMTEKKSTSRDNIEESKVERNVSKDSNLKHNNLNSLTSKRSVSKDELFGSKIERSVSRDDAVNANQLKRTESTDAMREKGSYRVGEKALSNESEFISKELKRSASTDAVKEKKSASRVESKKVLAQKPSLTDENTIRSEISTSLSKDDTKTKKDSSSSANVQKSTTKDDASSLSKLKVPACKVNVGRSRGLKRTASREDTECPRKIKRSHSKDDASSSRDSKRDSGISISGGLSEIENESKDRSCKPKRKYRKKKEKRDNYDCEICSKSFKGITDLRRHLLIHANEKPHVCKICNKAYRQHINLKNHMKVEHSKEKEFVCRYCTKPFPLKQRLKLHLRTHIGEKPYSCSHCSKTFARNGQLQQHLNTHNESAKKTCDVCPSTFTSEKIFKLHRERHEAKDFLCQICNTSFESEKGMRTHMSSAHGSLTNFECQICEKNIKDDLDTHMKTHAIARPHECEICKRVFAQKTQYNVHMRTHTGERPYQCRVCWQSFGHSNVLKLHIRKHTGEKPFKCVLCKESLHIAFSQLSHLKTHMKSIHKEEGAYICEGCKDCFKMKFHLENHVKTCEEVQSNPRTLTEEEQKAAEKDAEVLTQLRYLMAVLLKKISTPEKLAVLGFEKRLIDNVVIASLKLANRKAYDSKTINELDQMKLNIEAFLEWIVPKKVMNAFKKECPSIESILEKIVSMYLKQVE